MKRSRFTALFTIAPVLLLCACTTVPQFSFTANWYKNTAITSVNDTLEKLEYKVTFTPSNADAAFTVAYDEGKYTTELKTELLTLSDDTKKEGYSYTTELSISGRYTLNGTMGETFTDSVTSVVKFLPVEDKLQPVESLKTVHSTSPISMNPASLETAYTLYRYTYKTVYSLDMKSAHVTYTDLTQEEPSGKETNVKIESDYTYLDNEQIAFALRGVNFSTNAASAFQTINPVSTLAMPVNVTVSAVKEACEFELDGKTASLSLDAYSAKLVYGTTYSGQEQTVVYAATTDASSNTYRNVILSMSAPILQSLGTMNYKLVKAEFATKS